MEWADETSAKRRMELLEQEKIGEARGIELGLYCRYGYGSDKFADRCCDSCNLVNYGLDCNNNPIVWV